MQLFLQIYIIINIFIIGTLFGSFFSLATYRLPRKQDILVTRSYCVNCKHRLEFFDLIPVLSYLFLGGKCRYCGQRISPRYILLEISNGLVFVCMYLIFGYTFKFLIVALIYIFAFLLIGSYIMSKGIKPDEVIENKVVSKKSGVFIVELIIAFIMFTLFLLSQNLTSRNYNNSIAKTTAKSHAISIAVNNINKTLATNYDDLYSSTTKQVMDGITYSVDVGVYKYSDSHPDKKDIISTVEVNVNYVVLGQAQTFKLSALKERK